MTIRDILRRLFAPPAPAPQPGPPPTADDLLAAVNAARRAHGLPFLALDLGLEQTAGAWAGWLSRMGEFRHNPNAPGGECIEKGQPTAAACVADWLADIPHRVIVLGRYTSGGCGVASGRNGTVYVLDCR